MLPEIRPGLELGDTYAASIERCIGAHVASDYVSPHEARRLVSEIAALRVLVDEAYKVRRVWNQNAVAVAGIPGVENALRHLDEALSRVQQVGNT